MASPFQVIADALSGKGPKGAVTSDTPQNKMGSTEAMSTLAAAKLRMMNAQGLNFDGSPLKVSENTHGNRGPVNTHGNIEKNQAEQASAATLRPSK